MLTRSPEVAVRIPRLRSSSRNDPVLRNQRVGSQCVEVGSGYFFFQAEDGIRDVAVTGVQTCALPIYLLGFVFRGIRSPKDLPLAVGNLFPGCAVAEAKRFEDGLFLLIERESNRLAGEPDFCASVALRVDLRV